MHKVLVVDDDQDVLAVVCAILTLAGYHVEEADTAATARAGLERATPDVIICDWDLGGESSESLLLHLAATNPRTGRVLLTGSPPQHCKSLLDSGVVHVVLMKPFHHTGILAAIREALATASTR